MDDKYEIAVIGAGPGGYVAAIRAAQLKKKVLLIEEDKIGGTCMNRGCIPAKYLLQQTKLLKDLKCNKNFSGSLDKIQFNWKKVQEEKLSIVDRLVKGIELILHKNKVEIVRGKATLEEGKKIVIQIGKESRIVQADKIILAAGSRPSDLPFLKPNGKEVITSREALELESIPQKLLIVGGGAIGLELGTIFHRMGSEVTLLEIMPSILPGSDLEMVKRLQRILKGQGLKIFTHMKIDKYASSQGRVLVKGTSLKDNVPFEFAADNILLATGRRPNVENLGMINRLLKLQKNGFVKANARMETGIPGVYAIGDLVGGKLLAHKASHEGLVAAENSSGGNSTIRYDALPMAVYTDPEFSSVGLTEEEAIEKEMKIQTGLFSLQANGRALTMGQMEGAVKIIADEKSRIIGAHILSPNASELIAEMTLAVKKQMSLQEVADSVHVHPSLSEALMEAAMKARGEAIHMLNI